MLDMGTLAALLVVVVVDLFVAFGNFVVMAFVDPVSYTHLTLPTIYSV